MNTTSKNFVPVLIMVFLLWGVYRRVRRNIGRQPLQPRRLVIRICMFSLISLFVAFVGFPDEKLLLGFAGGILLGVPLALVGLRLTRFEMTPEGKFYTPSTHIGIALSLLFIGRLAYRMLALHDGFSATKMPAGFGKSPLTLGIFGLLAGYYVVYSAGVLLHSRDGKVTT